MTYGSKSPAAVTFDGTDNLRRHMLYLQNFRLKFKNLYRVTDHVTVEAEGFVASLFYGTVQSSKNVKQSF